MLFSSPSWSRLLRIPPNDRGYVDGRRKILENIYSESVSDSRPDCELVESIEENRLLRLTYYANESSSEGQVQLKHLHSKLAQRNGEWGRLT